MLLIRGTVEEKVNKIVQLKLRAAVIVSKQCLLRSPILIFCTSFTKWWLYLFIKWFHKIVYMFYIH